MVDITVALIAGGSSILVGVMTLLGVIITNSKSNNKIEQQLEINQAVTDTKLENLAVEVRKHNDFASRMPVVEEQIKEITRRIDEYHSA